MQWVHDKWLILRQLLTWGILILIYGTIFYVMFAILPPSLSNIGLLLIALLLFIQYFFSGDLILTSTGARIIEERDDPLLYNSIKRLATEADLPMPRVAIIPSPMPNAFATGRNHNHAVVAVTIGLRNTLARDEIDAVLAHELSHIKNYDMATMTITAFLAAVASSFVLSALIASLQRHKDIADVLIALLCLIAAVILVIITFLLTRLISRYRELAADRGSALITRNPDALIRALTKISSGVSRTTTTAGIPVTGAANLYYIIPAAQGLASFSILSTHPSLKKRIKNLEKVRDELRTGKITP